MKFTKFTLSEIEAAEIGLKPIVMNRLGSVVAISGKNGSGKSRLLRAVEAANNRRSQALPHVNAYRKNLIDSEKMLNRHPDHEAVESWRAQKLGAEKILNFLGEQEFDSDEVAKVVRFVPKNMNFRNPLADPPAELLSRFNLAGSSSINEFESLCLAYIQQSQNRWWNATHQNFSGEKMEKMEIIGQYDDLQKLVLALIGARVDRSIDGAAQLFGRNLSDASFSEGQKVLLQLAVAMHAQKSNFKDAIFILDELENHLHPSVAIDILDRIREIAPEAQIWLATHSIPLLAHVMAHEPSAIWYIENGEIAHAGRKPQLVLNSLLGDEERVGQLHAFTALPAQLAAINYAAESLLPPTVVAGIAGDPQVSQVDRVCDQLARDSILRILDFGAGKGRLLEGLAGISTREISEHVDYTAFDAYSSNADACKKLISSFYGNDSSRYFNDQDALLAEKGYGYFDAAVMCNVLHEIHPKSWLEIFSADAVLGGSLKDYGCLIVVEDMRIPTGERAHEHGFLVLDTLHLRTLFGVSQNDIEKKLFCIDDARGDGRLKAHTISKKLFSNVSTETRRQAITQLRDTALRKIEEHRRMKYSFVNGMMHGFWTQQYANASLFLRE